jgi:hypothetical protein
LRGSGLKVIKDNKNGSLYVSVPLRGSGLKDSTLPPMAMIAMVSVPLRGSGLKGDVFPSFQNVGFGWDVSVPLRGSGLKALSIAAISPYTLTSFRPLAGKWFERFSREQVKSLAAAMVEFPSPCGEVV